MRLLVALCALVIVRMAGRAQFIDVPDDPEKWIAGDPPRKYDERWNEASSNTTYQWVVTLRDGRPRVARRGSEKEPADPLPFRIPRGTAAEGLSGTRFTAKVDDGWIVAFNHGEFGAGLWWFSPDGKRRQKLAEDWINGFVPTEAGLLALEGIAHGGQSQGGLIRINRDSKGRWRTETIVDLKSPADAAAKLANGSVLVASDNQLIRVNPTSKKVEVLVDDAFWDGLYPTSMVVARDGSIYLAMVHGVARIRQKNGKHQVIWLVPEPFVRAKPEPEGLK